MILYILGAKRCSTGAREERKMKTFLRIGRHATIPEQEAWIRAKFGSDIQILLRDLPFGDDPVKTVAAAISEAQLAGHEIVAADVIGPLAVLARLLEAKREITVPLVRAVMKRDPATGRVIITGKDAQGRDVFAFERYERLVKVTIETAEL